MRNTLKFSLLCATFCTMNITNNNVYSMETNKNNMEVAQFEIARDNINTYGAAFTHAGLNNIGATCYMNATLQCLANDTDFVRSFLKEVISQYKYLKQKSSEKNEEANECKLVLDLANVMRELWTLPFVNGNHIENTSFSATEFRNTLEKCNPLFKSRTPGDSKDLLLYLFETIQKVLGYKFKNININTSSINSISEDFKKIKSCVLSNFYFVNRSKMVCKSCNYGINTLSLASFLIFPLEEVRKMKNLTQMLLNNNFIFNNNIFNNNNTITLYDCFDFNNKIDYFTGNNRISCNRCGQLSAAVTQNWIHYIPNTLAIVLNRGKGNEYDVKINIPERVDLQKHAENRDKNDYFLSSVVCHIKGVNGDDGYSDHFITLARTTQDSPWVKYNDSIVTVEQPNQINKILSGQSNITPYILFYKKMK